MKGLNAQFDWTSSSDGGDLLKREEKEGVESCREQGCQVHFCLWKRVTF